MESVMEYMERVYPKEYIAVNSFEGDGKRAWFKFNPVQIKVTKLPVKYMTPREVCLYAVQVAFPFFEESKGMEILDLTKEEVRGLHSGLMTMIAEINQRFRKEVKLSGLIEGKMILGKVRPGKRPFVEMGFDFGERAITGNLKAFVLPYKVPQINQDIMRI